MTPRHLANPYVTVLFLAIHLTTVHGGSLGIEGATVQPLLRTVSEGGPYRLVGVLEPIRQLKGGRFELVSKLDANSSIPERAPRLHVEGQPDGSISIQWQATSLFPFMIPQVLEATNHPVWSFTQFQSTATGGRLVVPPFSLKTSQLYRLVHP